MYSSQTHHIPNLTRLQPPAQAMACTSSGLNAEYVDIEPCDVCKESTDSVSYCTLCDKKLCEKHLKVCLGFLLNISACSRVVTKSSTRLTK